MNKIVALLVIIVLGASSCTREYICQCTVKYSGIPGLPDSSLQEFLLKNTLKQATADCAANNATITKNGITMTETCVLY
jgi:hypothetical protein